ncbi:MAG: ABC transporter ATP-binding protein [Desulfobacteraceae bacterium]|nr:ABC transporter ATP-binding protein [Desulfobacteraceae bacterium]
MAREPLLSVRDLEIKFRLRHGDLTAVNRVSFDLARGDRLGIVGESGAGKSVTGFGILNLVSKPGYIAGGRLTFEGRELTALPEEELRKIRGNRISMIFQDPMMTLNPVLTIGTQMVETILAHRSISRAEATEIALDRIRKVAIPSPEKRLQQYPHEFSGGMRQRIVIAIALLNAPALIIADEPTTALDVTIQADIMALLLGLCESDKMGLILITHDLAVVSQVAQRIAVMYAGTIVEIGPTDQVANNPQHPYTRGLLGALPQRVPRGKRLNQIPGMMPNLTRVPEGCPFNNRCTLCEEICRRRVPPLEPKATGCLAACHLLN